MLDIIEGFFLKLLIISVDCCLFYIATN